MHAGDIRAVGIIRIGLIGHCFAQHLAAHAYDVGVESPEVVTTVIPNSPI
jgi:hypothetical protein